MRGARPPARGRRARRAGPAARWRGTGRPAPRRRRCSCAAGRPTVENSSMSWRASPATASGPSGRSPPSRLDFGPVSWCADPTRRPAPIDSGERNHTRALPVLPAGYRPAVSPVRRLCTSRRTRSTRSVTLLTSRRARPGWWSGGSAAASRMDQRGRVVVAERDLDAVDPAAPPRRQSPSALIRPASWRSGPELCRAPVATARSLARRHARPGPAPRRSAGPGHRTAAAGGLAAPPPAGCSAERRSELGPLPRLPGPRRSAQAPRMASSSRSSRSAASAATSSERSGGGPAGSAAAATTAETSANASGSPRHPSSFR